MNYLWLSVVKHKCSLSNGQVLVWWNNTGNVKKNYLKVQNIAVEIYVKNLWPLKIHFNFFLKKELREKTVVETVIM